MSFMNSFWERTYVLYGITTLLCLYRVGHAYNLTCYTCTATAANDPCVRTPNMSDVVTCMQSEPFCKVFRVDSQYGDLMSLARGCSSACKNHCGIWGDDVDELRCYTCCNTQQCNDGNRARDCRSELHVILLVWLTVLCVKYTSTSCGYIIKWRP